MALLVAASLMLAIAIILVFLTAWGYGTVRFTGLTSNAAIYVNGHKITVTTLKLRPGTYQLAITSPTINPYESTFHVDLSHQTTVSTPPLARRDINAIASSLIGAVPGTSIPPQLTNARWFENDTWVVGTLSPTDKLIVMHYDNTQKQWSVAFSNNPGYSEDLGSLPPAIATYVQPLLAGGV
jgi:hypothetical protein